MQKLQTTVKGKLVGVTKSSFKDKKSGDTIDFAFVLIRVEGALYRFSVLANPEDFVNVLKKHEDKEVSLTVEFQPSADKASSCKVVAVK